MGNGSPQGMGREVSDTFTVNRGTDLAFSFNWPNGAGGNANLTGFTVAGFEVTPAAAAYLTLTLTNPATGLITGRLEWNDALPGGRVVNFRVRISQGANDTATNPIWVEYA